jgi:hypothetical protein
LPICNECNSRRSQTEKQAIIRQYIPSAVCFILGIFVTIPFLAPDAGIGGIAMAVICGYLMAGVFWGWKVISFIQPKMFLFLPIVGWLIYFLIKFLLSYFVGIVAMPIGIARIIMRHVSANAKEKNIEKNKKSA